jgi:hypothetical protein
MFYIESMRVLCLYFHLREWILTLLPLGCNFLTRAPARKEITIRSSYGEFSFARPWRTMTGSAGDKINL